MSAPKPSMAAPADGAEVGALRALAHRLRWWLACRLGWPGLAALALAALTAWLAAWAVPAARHQAQATEARLATQRAAAQARRAVAADKAELGPDAALLQWVRDLPTADQRGHAVAQLLQRVGDAGVVVERADYASVGEGPGPRRLSVSLPLTGTYAQLRRAVANVLQAMPHAGLESLQLERPDTKAEQLRATAVFVVFFRPEAP